jgi:GT2 family glycosyltransferase
LLLDNDVYLKNDCVERLIATQRETGASVVCPRIILLPDGITVQCDGAENHFVGTMTLRRANCSVETAPDERTEVGSAIGACYLLNRAAIIDAGSFDESYFFYFEDYEFSMRLRSQGHQFWFDSSAVTMHDRGLGTPGLSFRGAGTYPEQRAYLTLRNRWLTICLHYQLRTLLILTPVLLAYEVAAFLLCMARGWTGQWTKALLWLAKNRVTIGRKRVYYQRQRMIGDRSILRGGPIPLTSGLLESRWSNLLIDIFSRVLNAYWRIFRGLLKP